MITTIPSYVPALRLGCWVVLAWAALPAGAVDYAKEIKPLLKSHCYACHGGLKQKGGLRLDTVDAIKHGGDSGDAGKLLVERVTTTDKSDHMPPEGEGASLSADEVAKLKAWLDAGMTGVAHEEPEPDPRAHWAYQVPKSSGKTMDSLLADRFNDKHLKPQPQAAPEVWLRRVYLDLIGLPPSPEAIASFLAAPSAIARQQVVDQLLSAPQYGERWARHFMDIWRYCDWYGLGDQLRHSQKHLWHWRDWIIESLNSDKGYDQMVVQMLAADELAPEDRDNLRATGFLARSYFLFNRTTWLDDTIEHTCRAFLGVTMQCVKCHSHKYDPIEHADYYRMRAIFEPMHVRLDPWQGEADFEKNGLPRVYDLHIDQATYRHVRGDEKNEDKSKIMGPGVPEVLAFAKFEPRVVALPVTASKPATLPFVVSDQLAAALHQRDAAMQHRDPAAQHLAQLHLHLIQAVSMAGRSPQDKSLAAIAASATANYELAKMEADLAALQADAKPPSAKRLQAAKDAVTAALKKVANPGESYEPLRSTLKAQEGPDEKGNEDVQSYPETSTGRRLAFAQWVADQRNPLTARVLVNQVWTRHFGASLVPNGDDFGRRCLPPLHQDVLDTITVDFMQHGWSLKHLHRTLVLSDLYRRSSSNANADAATLVADPDNACYWRMNPRRMESQVVRDCLLQLAGKLDLTQGGPSIDPEKAESTPRRSLYFVQNADVEHRFLATFDNSNVLECYRRNESVVPQQALALTNSKLSRECADALSTKMQGLTDAEFMDQAFVTLLARPPTPKERVVAAEGLHALKQDRSLFLQALINHNDFVTLR